MWIPCEPAGDGSPSELTLYPTGKSWQSCVHLLTLRFRHSFTLQFLSSERSPQSSLPSQRLLSEMQRPLEHMKKEPLHKLPAKNARHRPSSAKPARSSPAKLGSTFVFDPTMDLDRTIPFKKSSCGSSAFCLGHMFREVSRESSAAADTNEEIPAESQTAVSPAARHLRFRGSSSEWSGQSA